MNSYLKRTSFACFSVLTLHIAAVLMVSLVMQSGQVYAASYTEINEKKDGQYDVTFGGKLFTTVHTKGHAKPILYPIIGPGDVRMTRDYPMKKGTAGEREDHPHHQSLWFTHGDVNGVSFWHIGKGSGQIVTTKVEKPVNSGSQASIVLHNKWVDSKGKVHCTDKQKITFHKPRMDGKIEYSMIDYEVTITASEGDVKFGDTKEGTMGIRTNPALRVNKGAAAVNSEGVTGKAVWGKKASWVDYSAKIGGKVVGVGIIDHPTNRRHPTTWHARDYGLVAANPFGLKHFQGKKNGEGNMVIKKGESVSFKYRFVFHQGDAKAANLAARLKEFGK
jgi:hypothetical protein